MLNAYYDEVYNELESQLEIIGQDEKEPKKKMNLLLSFISQALKKLKSYVLEHPFLDKTEEIHFLKKIKPRFSCLHIYYLERYNIETNVPAGDAESLKSFYRDELKALVRFFQHISFQYQYYRLGATELDTLYFLRGTDVQSVLMPEIHELDPDFATSCDYLFSKIKAYEMLQDYLVKALNTLHPLSGYSSTEHKELPELKWTGDKINLVEVIYGLYFTGQLNNGNADISVIIRFMEKHMQIDLSRAYRDFLDIRSRKKTSPTRYIEQMGDSIQKRIDDDMTLKQTAKKHF